MTRSTVRTAIAVLLLCAGAPTELLAQPSYHIGRYHTTLTVVDSGALEITETLTFHYREGSFRWAERSIALDDITEIEDLRVTGVGTSVSNVEQIRNGDHLRIRWEYPARTDSATFRLQYRAEGALYEITAQEAESSNDDRNLIEWNAVGDQWDVPVDDVEVSVHLPFGTEWSPSRIRIAPREDGYLEQSPDGWTAQFTHRALSPGTNYQIEVGFPKMFAGRSSESFGLTAVLGVLALFVLGATPCVLAAVRWGGPEVPDRDDHADQPPDLSLLQAAYLDALTTDGATHGIGATLHDLANRGYVRLRRRARSRWLRTTNEVSVEVIDRFEEETDLLQFERRLLDALDGYDTLREFSGISALSVRRELVHHARAELVRDGLVRRHRSRSRALLALCTGLILAGGSVLWLTDGLLAVAASALLFGGSVGSIIAALQRTSRTLAGVERLADVRAYLDQIRTDLETLRNDDPIEAANRFFEYLPWLTLDDEIDEEWVAALVEELERTEGDRSLEFPAWIEDTCGDDKKATLAATQFHHASAIAAVAVAQTSGGQAAGGMAGAAATAGAGAAGGAGGGGGAAG